MASLRPGRISAFRKFLFELSEHLTKEDVQSIIFLERGVIPEGKAENVTNGRQLFAILEQAKGQLHKDYLCELFKTIKRQNLVDCIEKDNFEGEVQVYREHQEGLEEKGYSVKIVGGKHYKTTVGEYVELRSGTNFTLHVSNRNNKDCHLDITIDDENYIGGWILGAHEDAYIERPVNKALKFTFYKVKSAPKNCGIQGECEANGLIKCKFTPQANGDNTDGLGEDSIFRKTRQAMEQLMCPKAKVTPESYMDHIDGLGQESRDTNKELHPNTHVTSSAPCKEGTVQVQITKNSYSEMAETGTRFTFKISEEQPISVAVEDEFTLETLETTLREKSEPFKQTQPGNIMFCLKGVQLDPAVCKGDILKYVKSDHAIMTAKVVDQKGSADSGSDEDGNSDGETKPITDHDTCRDEPTSKPGFENILDHVHDKAGTKPPDGVATRSFGNGEDSTRSLGNPGIRRNSNKGAGQIRYRCVSSTMTTSRPGNYELSSTRASLKDDWRMGAVAMQIPSNQKFCPIDPLQVDESQKVELLLRLVASEHDDSEPTCQSKPPAPPV